MADAAPPPQIDLENVKSAKIVQLCPVPPGFFEKRDDEPMSERRTVIALALIEMEVDFAGETTTGHEVWPLVCGYGEETDLLHLWTPRNRNLGDIYYHVKALGDHTDDPVIGYLPPGMEGE